MTLDVQTLSVSFNLPLQYAEINQWRGAFIEMGGWEDSLFHNHKTKDTYHYRYPLIQYRSVSNRAALFAIGDGIPAFRSVLGNNDWFLNWNGQKHGLQIEHLKSAQTAMKMLKAPQTYRLGKWLALNQNNYKHWQNTSSLLERAALLERVLVGQLLGFCTAMGYRLHERLEVCLENIDTIHKVRLHGNAMIAFDISYSANIMLPKGIALGKGKSVGFGRQSFQSDRNYAQPSKYDERATTLLKV